MDMLINFLSIYHVIPCVLVYYEREMKTNLIDSISHNERQS